MVDAAQRFRIPVGDCGQGLQRVEQRAQNRRLDQRRQAGAKRIGVMSLLQGHDFMLHGFFGTRVLARGVLVLDALDLRLEHLYPLHRTHLGKEERQQTDADDEHKAHDRDTPRGAGASSHAKRDQGVVRQGEQLGDDPF